jgi:4-diphosphocytidyl-2-C-methyl-D-erythritol kinase
MVSFPPCKINLGLHVTTKRTDGYHDIETCFYPVPWTDILEVIPSQTFQFTSSGQPVGGSLRDNLCVRAYEVLKKDFNLSPVKIHLHKVLPMGAGLGGGSSNAAHTLRLLNRVLNLALDNTTLEQHALKLGSDCPFFIQDKPKLGFGRGEILQETQVSLAGKFIVLINPGIHVSTQMAYAGVVPSEPAKHIHEILSNNLTTWKRELKNDFEETVFKMHPVLEQIKQELYRQGAQYASMSGSGSTLFGIFNQPIDLKGQFPQQLCWSGLL